MPKDPRGEGRVAARALAILVLAALTATPAWGLHKESPGAYRITRGASHYHPPTRSWGNFFAFSSTDDLAGTGNTRREIFMFNLAYFDCFNGTTFPATPCPSPLKPFLVQLTNGPGEPDNPSIALPFDSTSPPDGVDDNQWLAFDALGNFSGGTGLPAAHRQIFLKNLVTNEIRQVTFGTDGDSVRPTLSSLGGMIVFESTARLTNNPTPAGVSQVYAYETNNRILRQLTAGAGASTAPAPNNSGVLIAFQSTADLLGTGADTGVSQIYWAEYDKKNHASTLHRLTHGNAPSLHPYVSEVNSFIVFESSATNLPGTVGGTGSSIYMSTPLTAPSPQPPTLRQLTVPTDFGNCTYPTVDAGSVADHIGFLCDGDPLGNATVGNRVFVIELSTLTLFQLTGSGDVQPPIGGSLGSWFLTLSTTSALTGLDSCGYQLYFIDYLPEKWAAATQRGQLPPDSLQAAGGSNLIGVRTLKVLPGDGAVGSRLTVTTADGAFSNGPPQGGALRLVMGAPDEFTGEAPIRLDARSSVLQPVVVPGFGAACFGLAADGQGTIDCDGGLAGDLTVVQDHMTDDTNPLCLAPDCREDAGCQGSLFGPHRIVCPVCSSGEVGPGTCVGGANDGQPCSTDGSCQPAECVNGTVATCNGAVTITPSGSLAPGGVVMTVPLSFSFSTFAGADGKYCTGDDSYTTVHSIPVELRLTTGSATGSILDRDETAAARLDVTDTGLPFDCNRVRAGDLGGARLIGVFPLLDVPNVPALRDLMVSLRIDPAPPDASCTTSLLCASDNDCNDGDACNGGETCIDGLCVSGNPFICSDGDPCNGVETCDPGTGACVAGPPCNDGDPCNGEETCDATNGCQAGTPIVCADADACNGVETCNSADATCLPGTAPDCDDLNPCTADSCDASAGCVHLPIAGSCDDGDACTSGDACQAGVCVGSVVTVCDDGNACNGTETCDSATGFCQAGTAPVCDDGNSCTDDSCDPDLGCLFQNRVGACDDGSACTSGDVCVAGTCTGTPLLCDDLDACNGVETCNPADGTCQPGTALVCDDGNPCTDDSCSPIGGCVALPNVNACDDGDACTTGDTCAAGACVGVPTVCSDGNFCNGTEACNSTSGLCEAGSPPNCDDGDGCTTDSCDPVAGVCVNTVDSGGVLCLLGNLIFEVQGANPAALATAGRQQRLVTRLVTVRNRINRAVSDPLHALRNYRRAYRGLGKFQRVLHAGMIRLRFDPVLASGLIDSSGRVMAEVTQLMNGS